MVFSDILKKYGGIYSCGKIGSTTYVFPDTDDPFDHTVYKFDDPNNVEAIDLVYDFLGAGLDSKIEMFDKDELLFKYSQK